MSGSGSGSSGSNIGIEEVDILLTGVTGFVGRFILHELLERCPEKRIAVIIRSSGKISATQRWATEIMGSTLFGPWEAELRKVRVIDAALEHLETTTHHLKKATTLIHCAANIKHYDPYEALERDNVRNVERVLKLAESLDCQHLLLLSTCYVHPRSATDRPVKRITSSPQQADFYNDYCYTKWRGEEAVYAAKTTIPHITIARLSCVGAPARWDLAAHPCAAQAHLGVVSLALRGFLEVLAWRPQARISTIPVDLVAKGIVDQVEAMTTSTPKEKIMLLQLCPPPELTTYHQSLPLVISILQSEFGLEEFRGLAREDSRGLHLAWWKQVAYSYLSRGQKAITLHSHVQDFVSTFTDQDLRFASSLHLGLFPAISEQEVVRQTCAYAVRILHHRQLAKGAPITRLDQFWHRLANREPVQVCIRLRGEGEEGVGIAEWPEFARKVWAVLLQHQKCATGLSNASPLDGPITWRQVSGHSLTQYFAPPQSCMGDETSILVYGLQQAPPERLWHCTPFLTAETTHVSHILVRFDHGLMDGTGALSILPEFAKLETTVPPPLADARPPRTLSLWMDLWMGLVYLVLLFTIAWSAPSFTEDTRSKEPTVATATTGFVGPPSGRTYTTEVLWKLTQQCTTLHRQPEHIFAVPAVIAGHRAAKDMIGNECVPILLPVDGRMTEEAFAHRCMLLRARSVRFISWCIVQLLEWGVWDEIRDLFLGKVRCVVSSLQAGSLLPPSMESVHVVTTTPTPIPYSVTVISSKKGVFFTARSHNPNISAETLLAGLVNTNEASKK